MGLARQVDSVEELFRYQSAWEPPRKRRKLKWQNAEDIEKVTFEGTSLWDHADAEARRLILWHKKLVPNGDLRNDLVAALRVIEKKDLAEIDFSEASELTELPIEWLILVAGTEALRLRLRHLLLLQPELQK